MPFNALQKIAYKLYKPILVLEDVFPYRKRKAINTYSNLSLAVLAVISFVGLITGSIAAQQVFPAFGAVAILSGKTYGLLLIVFAIKFSLVALEAFNRSYYGRGLNLILSEIDSDNDVPVSYEVAAIMHYSEKHDLLHGFLTSPYGEDIMIRLGIMEQDLHDFLGNRQTHITSEQTTIESEPHGVTLPVYVRSLYKQDQEFQQFLFKREIQLKELEGAADWIMRTNRLVRNNERWYSRDVLGRIEGLGKSLAYGEKYTLERYGHYIINDPVYVAASERSLDEDTDVEAIEAELSRSRQANVVLVGKDANNMREVLAQLAHKIHEGHVLPPIEHKKIFLFDVGALVAVAKEKGAFEELFKKALYQAAASGNIILVIENLAASIHNAMTINADIVSLMADYFDAPELQIVVTTSEAQLHKDIEADTRMKTNFEIVRLHDLDETGLVRVLEQRAIRLEQKHQPIVTYQGLVDIIESADRYFTDGVMPDKALDLLEESMLYAESQGVGLVTKKAVEGVVAMKTGIPMGDISGEEQQKLMNLETELSKRVIGQVDAVHAIAGAMRRARSGINDPKRPFGTFLFLGPTGVGKTETTKALAYSFFGDENAMHRLDMSEFQTTDALERLIGFSDGTPGRLTTMLKEKPYHVVLLDEFEKANQDVHDLFLQILDEGQFSDPAGEEVNARNTIIIATSNAGADLIWDLAQSGADLGEHEHELIDAIIHQGIFRPELINRFDGVILFHPLIQDEVKEIANIQLQKLAERMREKGIDLAITQDLIDFVGEEGYDPQFGGRQMNRAIKEHVEQVIADKIISGEIQRGQTVSLTRKDLQ